MTTRDNAPPPADWTPCPHDCPPFELAGTARHRIDTGADIPPNIVLSDN